MFAAYRLFFIGAAVALSAHPVSALQDKIELWRGIAVGMTAAEVQSLFPEGKRNGTHVEHHRHSTELHGFVKIGSCKPKVEVFHKEGTVTGLVIGPHGLQRNTCVDAARSAALARFGEPDSRDRSKPAVSAFHRASTETMTWLRPGMVAKWRNNNAYNRWTLEYVASESIGASEL